MSEVQIWSKDSRVKVVGGKAQVDAFMRLLDSISDRIVGAPEDQARTILARLPMKSVTVIFSGNRVWDKWSIVNNVRLIVKMGDMNKMSKYTYEFFSLVCGSIAHYDRAGWINTYPTVGSLQRFFVRNEFGRRVIGHIPRWHSDARAIVEELEKIILKDYWFCAACGGVNMNKDLSCHICGRREGAVAHV